MDKVMEGQGCGTNISAEIPRTDGEKGGGVTEETDQEGGEWKYGKTHSKEVTLAERETVEGACQGSLTSVTVMYLQDRQRMI